MRQLLSNMPKWESLHLITLSDPKSDTALVIPRPPIKTSSIMQKKKHKSLTDEEDDLLDNNLILRRYRDSDPEKDNAVFELQLISNLKKTLRDYRIKEEEEQAKARVQAKQMQISELFAKSKPTRQQQEITAEVKTGKKLMQQTLVSPQNKINAAQIQLFNPEDEIERVVAPNQPIKIKINAFTKGSCKKRENKSARKQHIQTNHIESRQGQAC
ncbi:hypothetical protein FGO68_gene2383 [Halteria grandinella]|uniref:Uncharacterized protein n=1 Tax=Halteria grandinella TaxID=5974 RepID=A0A8J8NC01_HALGN|nr:hypothetical protein FGO68_gene2383 [Halteria grandinella]